jgi:hypothetical protein
MMTLGSEFIVKSIFVLKSAALAVDDVLVYASVWKVCCW